jgi:hypothetical protein
MRSITGLLIIGGYRLEIAWIILAGFLGHSLLRASAQREEGVVVLENFEQYGASKFSRKWRGASGDAQGIYRIEAELGNHFPARAPIIWECKSV